jgi:hypothetical protein
MTTTDKTLFWGSRDEDPSSLYPDSEDGKAEAIYEAIEREMADDEGRIPETVEIWAWKPKENKIDISNDAVQHVNGIIGDYEEEYSYTDEEDFTCRFDAVAIHGAILAVEVLLRSLKPELLEEVHSETINIREWAAIGDNGTATFQDDDEQWVMLTELLKREEVQP